MKITELNEMEALATRAGAERDALQQRIDKALAFLDGGAFWFLDQHANDSAQIRAILTGTER